MGIVLFNSDKKELIGVFSSTGLASRYLFPFGNTKQRNGTNVCNSIRGNCGIRNTDLGCRVVARRRTDKDHLINPELGYYIADGYRGFVGQSDKQFTDTAKTLREGSNEKLAKYWSGQNAKKSL